MAGVIAVLVVVAFVACVVANPLQVARKRRYPRVPDSTPPRDPPPPDQS